ncbi:MAG TPA: hypothetical protein VK123_01430 [Candidatus Limnocylindrales bacterium]|nr:hypothetical protein [Candidatus Limnocylindrales bacterium]
MRAGRGVRAVLILAFVAGMAAASVAQSAKNPLPGKKYTWSLAADTLGLAPTFTRAAGGTWAVVEDSTSGTRLIRQLEAEEGIVFHVLQFLKPSLADQEMSVRVRIRSGEIDPSVGIAFQLDAKGKNGYLVRVSGKSRELIAHYLINGRRRDIKYARIESPRLDEWHTLAVRRVGSVMEIRYDGALLMKLRDERFERGNIGLWTEDDTVADFTDLTLTSL